jgi:hypothetical protein
VRFGRLPRARNPRVPHMSALLAGRTISPPPATCNYTAILPPDLGMMGNNSLGDCTCAALGHALQVWTANANPPIDTEPDANIIALYSGACGYVAGQPNTDQGGVEQDVLQYAMLSGIPTGADGSGRHRITAYVEVDPRNQADVELAIFDFGLSYIGFSVPDFAMSSVGQLWDVQPGTANIVGGHAVILAAYDSVGPTCITWGKTQKMTWAFFQAFTDEAYAIADQDWIENTGKTPLGMSLGDLESQMEAIKAAS